MRRSTILTCIGAVGVVITSIMVAKAAPKAVRLLDQAEEEKGEELTTIEKVKTAAPVYIPATLVGASTIACIFGANVLNKRDQAALMSAYALANRTYTEYKDKISGNARSQIKEIIAKDQYDDGEEISEGKQLFFDFNNMTYFESTLNEVLQKVTLDDGMECYIISTPFEPLLPYIYD